jgi:hypothetical protein
VGVLDGLKPGDRVIVDGIQKVSTGMRVNPRAASHKAGCVVRLSNAEENNVSNFFIKRPIVAMVIAIITVIVGAVSDRTTCPFRSFRISYRRRYSF